MADHLGTIRDIATYEAVTDTTTVINHITYDSFGNITSETDPASGLAPTEASILAGDFPFAFTSREFDAETPDLMYYRARYYITTLGSWISNDPLGFVAGDANLNRYVANDPANSLDPSGLKKPWFNNDWTDWINPLAYIASHGYSLGERIGEGYAALFVKDQKLSFDVARARQERHIQELSDPNSNVAPDDFGRERLDVLGDGLREAADDAYRVADGTVATVELTADVVGVVDLGAAAPGLIRTGLRRVTCPLARRSGTRALQKAVAEGAETGVKSISDDIIEQGTKPAAWNAPKGTRRHYTDFADEAAEIMENAARRRGLDPNAGVRAMAAPSRDVDLSKLVPPRTRSVADPAKLQRLGPFDWSKYRPIQVEDLGGGRYMIMDGMTRVEAARRAGITKLPVQIFPKSGP